MQTELVVDTEQELAIHVFLSFAHEDQKLARRIAEELSRRGLEVWADFDSIQPGSPDWERDVRGALDSSVAVVLLASPYSRASLYVRGELALAREKGLTIFPLWISGDQWTDSVALDLIHAQYIDIRTDQALSRLSQLQSAVQTHIGKRLPGHILIRRALTLQRTIKNNRLNTDVAIANVPPGYIGVILDNAAEAKTDPSLIVSHFRSEPSKPEAISGTEFRSGALLRLSQYRVVGHLLDDVFTRFLSERYAPFTYGRDWLLIRGGSHRGSEVLCPWSWLDPQRAAKHDLRSWAEVTSLTACGLVDTKWWTINDANPREYMGISSPDAEFLNMFKKHPKFAYSVLRSMKRVAVHTPQQPDVIREIVYKDSMLGRLESRTPLAFEHQPGDPEIEERRKRYWRR
jgi:hypothetical protein